MLMELLRFKRDEQPQYKNRQRFEEHMVTAHRLLPHFVGDRLEHAIKVGYLEQHSVSLRVGERVYQEMAYVKLLELEYHKTRTVAQASADEA